MYVHVHVALSSSYTFINNNNVNKIPIYHYQRGNILIGGVWSVISISRFYEDWRVILVLLDEYMMYIELPTIIKRIGNTVINT